MEIAPSDSIRLEMFSGVVVGSVDVETGHRDKAVDCDEFLSQLFSETF